MFTCVGMMGFQNVYELDTPERGVVYWVNCALGNWDLEIFDALTDKTPP